MTPYRALLGLHFWNDGVRTAMVVLLPLVAHDIALSYSTIGVLGGAQSLLTAALAIPAGFFAARLGRMRLILGALALYSLGAVVLGAVTSAIAFVPLFFCAAIGFGIFHIVAYSQLSNDVPANELGAKMGNLTAIGDIGRIIISSAALFVASVWGWRPTMLVLGSIGLVLFALLYRTRASDFVRGEQGESPLDWLRTMFAYLRTRRTKLTAAAAFFDAAASSPIVVFLPFFLIEAGVSTALLGIITAGYFAGNFLGKTGLGKAVDVFGNVRVFIGSEVLMALAICMLAASTSFWFLLVTATLLGLFSKGTSPVVNTLWSDLGSSGHYEKVYAIGELFGGVASAATTAVLGVIAAVWGVTMVMYVCGALAICAALPMLFVSRR